MNNPKCPACQAPLPWGGLLRQLLGPRRVNAATWGAVCPGCGAQLKVPAGRVLLIGACGIFFGSQSSTILVLRDMTTVSYWLATLWLIVGFYALAIFFLLKLEPCDEPQA
ncbi:hypothetical protein KDM41_12625 [bacterium]|nr:hypothetical protein [bacterium]